MKLKKGDRVMVYTFLLMMCSCSAQPKAQLDGKIKLKLTNLQIWINPHYLHCSYVSTGNCGVSADCAEGNFYCMTNVKVEDIK